MAKDKRSFFERLAGVVSVAEESSDEVVPQTSRTLSANNDENGSWQEEDGGELAVDVYQNTDDIVIQAMVGGVKPEDLDISISRDMVTIKGRRETSREVSEDNYFFKELYWGSFSRTILLPQEIEVEESEAMEKNGLLTLVLPKVDKGRQTKLRVKSSS